MGNGEDIGPMDQLGKGVVEAIGAERPVRVRPPGGLRGYLGVVDVGADNPLGQLQEGLVGL